MSEALVAVRDLTVTFTGGERPVNTVGEQIAESVLLTPARAA